MNTLQAETTAEIERIQKMFGLSFKHRFQGALYREEATYNRKPDICILPDHEWYNFRCLAKSEATIYDKTVRGFSLFGVAMYKCSIGGPQELVFGYLPTDEDAQVIA